MVNHIFKKYGLYLLFISVILFLHACGDSSKETPVQDKPQTNTITPALKQKTKPVMLARDLEDIKKRGELRVLTIKEPDLSGLPRQGAPFDYEKALLENLAECLKLKLVTIELEEFEGLIPALLRNEGDIIAANLTRTPERRKIIDFSIPLFKTEERIVTSTSNHMIKSVADLTGKTLVIEQGTCYWEHAERLRKRYPKIKLLPAPDGIDTEELLHQVSVRKYDATIADGNFIDSFQTYCPDIKTIHNFSRKQAIAWGVSKGAPRFRSVLNRFLRGELPKYLKKNYRGDLPSIKKRRILRVLTRNNAANYFIHRGKLLGFEFELAREFARRHGLHLVVVTPPTWGDLIPWLIEGKGDIIASSMTITEKRKANPEISFGAPYCRVAEQVLTRKNDNSIKSIRDLKGRTFVVRKQSSYWETLEKLRDSGVAIKLIAAPENLETCQIIDQVSKGEYDLTLADSTIVKQAMAHRRDIKVALSLKPTKRYAWIVRSKDLKLKKAVDDFFHKEFRGLFYNVLFKKYFSTRQSKPPAVKFAAGNGDFKISSYDSIIKKYSLEYNFHWCLIAAQIYHESGFDPKAESWLGTKGLMQLSPGTARDMGFKNFSRPDPNIHAGVKYLHVLRKRFNPKDIKEHNRLCFALASYNCGYGHVLDARRLAVKQGLNPDLWFQNVEKAIDLLSRDKFAAQAKYGYCRSHEVIKYVKDIIFRFEAYKDEEEKK